MPEPELVLDLSALAGRWNRHADLEALVRAVPQVKQGVSTPLLEYAALGMRFEPAAGGAITAGIDKIIDALDWDAGRPPRLFIAASCRNLIWSMLNWKNIDGEKGATKDPIDCLRYLFTSGCTDCATTAAAPAGRWSASLSRFTGKTPTAPSPRRNILGPRIFR